MTTTPDFDLTAVHKFFSAFCFNRAWDLMDKEQRTAEENEQMLQLSMASIWHWTQRTDCTAQHLSIGYWQLSRIYAMLNQPDSARYYAQLSLQSSQQEGVLPFYRGYAYEALARAEAIAGQRKKRDGYLQQARQIAEKLPKPEARQQLLADLDTIK